MNKGKTKEYMLEGIQERIDKLSYEIWSRKYREDQLAKEKKSKKLNKSYL